jgi:hypothetical protein
MPLRSEESPNYDVDVTMLLSTRLLLPDQANQKSTFPSKKAEVEPTPVTILHFNGKLLPQG